ncbi:MAG: hypothetical protein GX964_10250 [Syntrophomonadaceae bacterium]|jgi:chemotaxis protein histidine kinase CheA|nr:hypothetical protein [Syntrophomonadaceae bacterium]
MVRTRRLSRIICLVVIVCLVFFGLCGCGSRSQSEPKKPTPGMEQKPRAPEALDSILKELDAIITEVDAKWKTESKTALKQATELAPSLENRDKKQKQEEDKQKKDESPKSEKSSADEHQNQSTSPTSNVAWQNEIKSLKKIHENWNMVEPEAIKAGLTTTARDNFEQTLNVLTQEINQHRVEGTLFAAITLYGHYADISQLFSTPIPAEFFRVKYEIMNSNALVGKREWETARTHAARSLEHWGHLKVQAEGIEPKLLSRTEFSLHDFDQAVTKKQAEVAMIKGEIVMKNLQNMEKELSQRLPSRPTAGTAGTGKKV